MKTRTFSCRCRDCRQRTMHRQTIGKVRPDVERPDDPAHRCEDVTLECLVCGKRQEAVQYPFLLAEFFSIGKPKRP